MSTSTDFGQSWTYKTIPELMPFDTLWAENEKINSDWSNRRWDISSARPLYFNMHGLRFGPDGDLYAAFVDNTSQAGSFDYSFAGLIANVSKRQLVTTGWSQRAAYEDGSLVQTYDHVPWNAAEHRYCFTWANGTMVSNSQAFGNAPGDSYPYYSAYTKEPPTTDTNSLMYRQKGYAYDIHYINNTLICYGTYGINQSSYSNQYKFLKYAGEAGQGIAEWGGQYTVNCQWNGQYWQRQNNPLDQPEGILTSIGTGTIYLASRYQRPVKWYGFGRDHMVTSAAVSDATESTFYSTPTNGVKYDYTGDFYGVYLRAASRLVPIKEKAAFILWEMATNAGSAVEVRIKISASGLPGSFTPSVRFLMPTNSASGAKMLDIQYSTTQNKFVFTYLSNTNLVKVFVLDDPFVCVSYGR